MNALTTLVLVSVTLSCSRGKSGSSAPTTSATATSAVASRSSQSVSARPPVAADSANAPVHAATAAPAAIRTWRNKALLPSYIAYAALWDKEFSEFRLHALGNKILANHGASVARFEDRALVPLEAPITEAQITDYLWLGGTWPDHIRGVAIVGIVMPPEFGGYPDFSEQPIEGRAGKLDLAASGVHAELWSRGRWVTLRGGVFEVRLGPKDGGLPEIALGRTTECATRFVPLAFGASPDGRIVAVGPSCETKGMLAVETWDGAGGEGTFQLLSGSEVIPRQDECVTPPCAIQGSQPKAKFRVLLGAKGAGYVFVTAGKADALWRLESTEWHQVLYDARPELWSVTLDAEGNLWWVDVKGSAAIVRLKRNEWIGVGLPSETEIRQALGAPAIAGKILLRPTTLVDQRGTKGIGASIVVGGNAVRGGAVLVIGSKPAELDAATLAPPDGGA